MVIKRRTIEGRNDEKGKSDVKWLHCTALHYCRYFKELENLIYEQTGYEEKCDEEQVRVALLEVNPDLPKLELRKKLTSCFPKGVETTTVSLAVSTLKRGATKSSSRGKKGKRAGIDSRRFAVST